MIGKFQRVPLREVWTHEVHFTQWLENNIDVLNDVVDLQLQNVEREQAAGAFSVDLVAEDQDGNLVVIENQLEKSNHDHLGKLVTYLTALGAHTGIWIVSEPRPEHVSAVVWLNESSSASFFLLKLETHRIGNSEPAPLLTLITGPSEEAREIGDAKKEFSERYLIRQRFWAHLLERSKSQTRLFSNISPSRYSFIQTSTGTRGLSYVYSVRQHDAQVEVYIDSGTKEENEEVFDRLQKSQDQIESAFGDKLDWQRLPQRRSCRIRRVFESGGWRDEEKWSDVQDDLIEGMGRLERAFGPHIEKL